MSAPLEVSGVSVRFGSFDAVRDVSFAVHAGEIVGLIGPNGAGKTVTFNVASGLQRPRRGRVLVDGVDVTGMPTHARARLGLARTFQLAQLFAGMTVVENLAVAAHRFTSGGIITDALVYPRRRAALREARERAEAVLRFLGLEELADLDVGSIPIGVTRLVELARALCLRPRVLLLDEPASGLDSHETRDLAELIAGIRAALGCSVLIVEHDMDVIMPLCDEVLVMSGGELIASGTPAEIRANPEVLNAYLGAIATDAA
ncbi:MAG TPA: ABC transporter ATP-binding protein [Candidatus Solibacter sp.]|jgi:branched-chain amino acid transport system ATP-binding protein|nr:ABC transporter ATP-binding protein [Candidatus Solibacter sp.]